MLNKISLTNFKSFKSMPELEIKNLTVIVGKNSCGKSSILQSLLLLKQTLESSSNAPLSLEGKYIKYSNLKEMAYGLPAINQAQVKYDLFFKSEEISTNVHLSFKNKRINDSYDVVINEHQEYINNDEIINYGKLNLRDINKIIKEKMSIIVKNEKITDFSLTYNKFLLDGIEVTIVDKDDKKSKFKLPWFMFLDENKNLNYELEQEINNIRYLSPVRAIPERVYVHYSHNVNALKEDGSNAAHILWSKQNELVSWKGQYIKLKEAVNKCIECMGLSQQITPDRIGDILYKVGMYEKVSGGNVALSDVGFGYSQILPVIIMGLINDKSNLMLLEQPEIHLHPSSAANLADLFLNFIEDEKRFMIETHSPEFINRLRLRVIENPSLKDKINIVFVESTDDEGSKIKQFSIDENGMFPEWPDGFLDESEKLAQAILEARLSKM